MSGGEPPFQDFDQAHEGHGGWSADMVLNNIDQWAQQTNPDIVLIHIGTNDLWSGESITSTINEISQIIDRIRVVNPNVAILLAQIIPNMNIPDSTLQAFNSEIAILAAQKTTQNSPVISVDQWTGFDVNNDTYDGVHPNDQGEQKMADKWLLGLNQVLPTPGPVPPELSNTRITLNMRSDDNDAFGIMFRCVDNHNYYRFSWNQQRLYRRLVKVVGGQFSLLAEDAEPYVTGQSYQLEIVALDSMLEVWIDGVLIFSVTDTDLTEGYTAFYCWGDMDCSFDDLVVENMNTSTVILSEDFNNGLMTDWDIVDEGTEMGPESDWSATSGTLVQSSNLYSFPEDPADLTKLGTYAVYEGPGPQDSDGDGIVDDDETNIYGTDPLLADTDDDGIGDGEELSFWGAQWDGDVDGDGLVNLLDPDSDNDGVLDGYENYSGTDPLDNSSTPTVVDWADYRLKFTMRSDDNDAIGVMFRYQDNQNYYRLAWNQQRPYRRLVKVENGQFTLLAEEAPAQVYVTGRTYLVKIVARGPTLEVWIDGVLILSAEDTGTSLAEGSIAFYCWGNQGSVFDDVMVESLATGAMLLSEDFNNGLMTDWDIVDEGTEMGPESDWSATSGTLVQSSNLYSFPEDPADLTKLGTYAIFKSSSQ